LDELLDEIKTPISGTVSIFKKNTPLTSFTLISKTKPTILKHSYSRVSSWSLNCEGPNTQAHGSFSDDATAMNVMQRMEIENKIKDVQRAARDLQAHMENGFYATGPNKMSWYLTLV
jgi:hypothetical protein